MTAVATQVRDRVNQLDWTAIENGLNERGHAHSGNVLTREECVELRSLYDRDTMFRNVVNMERHRFGIGSYKYFNAPLPHLVQQLRESLYPRLSGLANRWSQQLGSKELFPNTLDDFLETCVKRGQTKPTPLLLRYSTDGYNCLHQDIYGDIAFPLQAVFVLSELGHEFTGGEFLLVEQRPRAQSVGHAVTPTMGDMVVFTTRNRPVKGARGFYRANVRHGVSRVIAGNRCTLGIIFHNAK